MQQGDYYMLLEVPVSATAAEIKKSYHRLALRYHPDRNPGSKEAGERFRRIAEAYSTLADPALRAEYDRRVRGSASMLESRAGGHAYLRVSVSAFHVPLNTEVEVCFYFPSEGRIFRKPPMKGWEICSGPTVSHREIDHEGETIRETVLRYNCSPLMCGTLEIPSASIRFGRSVFHSDPQKVLVRPQRCYFTKSLFAGSDPVRLALHREVEIVSGNLRKTFLHTHTVLLPRSDEAARQHRHGRVIKTAVTLGGGILCIGLQLPVLSGLIIGNLLAGLCIGWWYRIKKIRPLYASVWSHPLIQEHESAGFQPGKQPSYGWLSSKSWMKLKMLLS